VALSQFARISASRCDTISGNAPSVRNGSIAAELGAVTLYVGCTTKECFLNNIGDSLKRVSTTAVRESCEMIAITSYRERRRKKRVPPGPEAGLPGRLT
jgi:hypothetical protein